jgi:hypothetical protein
MKAKYILETLLDTSEVLGHITYYADEWETERDWFFRNFHAVSHSGYLRKGDYMWAYESDFEESRFNGFFPLPDIVATTHSGEDKVYLWQID